MRDGDPVVASPLLGQLPDVVQALRDVRGRCRREVVSAIAVAGERQQRLVRRLEAVLNEVDQPVVVWDAHSRVALYNPGAQRLFGGDPLLGLGQSLRPLYEQGVLSQGLILTFVTVMVHHRVPFVVNS